MFQIKKARCQTGNFSRVLILIFELKSVNDKYTGRPYTFLK